jgi:hypothetical protein
MRFCLNKSSQKSLNVENTLSTANTLKAFGLGDRMIDPSQLTISV